jgi:hypothetical protein
MLSTGQRKRAAAATDVSSGAALWCGRALNGLMRKGVERLGAALAGIAEAAARCLRPHTSRSTFEARRKCGWDEPLDPTRASGGGERRPCRLPMIFFLLVATLFPFAWGRTGRCLPERAAAPVDGGIAGGLASG